MTLSITADTQIWDPPSKDAKLADIKTGDRVAVLAEGVSPSLVAKRILVIPSKPIHQQMRGVVTAMSGNQVTITDSDGKTVTADLPPGIARKVEVGDVVTAVVIVTPGVEKVLVKDIQNSNSVSDRLARVAQSKNGKDKDNIQAMLDRNNRKNEEVLNGVIARLPDSAKPGLQRAMDKSNSGRGNGAPGKPGGPSAVVPPAATPLAAPTYLPPVTPAVTPPPIPPAGPPGNRGKDSGQNPGRGKGPG